MSETIIGYFSSVNHLWATFWLSMLPLTELRLALPVALTSFQLPIWQAFAIAVLGNFIPAILIVYLLDPFANYLSLHSRMLNKFFAWLFSRTRRKLSTNYKIYGAFALALFVAIPLPITGAWTGAVGAFVFGIKPKQALPSIFLGLLIAGVVVSALTLGLGVILGF